MWQARASAHAGWPQQADARILLRCRTAAWPPLPTSAKKPMLPFSVTFLVTWSAATTHADRGGCVQQRRWTRRALSLCPNNGGCLTKLFWRGADDVGGVQVVVQLLSIIPAQLHHLEAQRSPVPGLPVRLPLMHQRLDGACRPACVMRASMLFGCQLSSTATRLQTMQQQPAAPTPPVHAAATLPPHAPRYTILWLPASRCSCGGPPLAPRFKCLLSRRSMASSITPVLPAPVGADTTCERRRTRHVHAGQSACVGHAHGSQHRRWPARSPC
jgi:hypothetical protein